MNFSVCFICYFTDDKGFIFTKSPIFSNNILFTFFTDIQNKTNPVGQFVLNAESFNKLEILKNYFKDKAINVYSVVVKDNNFNFLLEEEKDSASKIIISLADDPTLVIKFLNSALDELPLSEYKINNFKDLEYIDLRFGNKISFKKK